MKKVAQWRPEYYAKMAQ